MKRLLLFVSFSLTFFFYGNTQVNIPGESQSAQVEQEIGFTTVNISYTRPNKKKRTLFGEMIPWNSIWRTGANANTKIRVSKDVFLNGQRLPKGNYALYTIPTPEEWTIVINKDTSLWGHYGYDEKKDFFRFKVTPQQRKDYYETFTIAFENVNSSSADIVLRWGRLCIPFQIKIDEKAQHKEILQNIKNELQKPDDHDDPMIVAHNYFHAAIYYHKHGMDMQQALKWMDHSISLQNVSYFHLYKSDLLADMGRYKEALNASKEGLAIFMKTGKNKEWIWRYERQIKKLEKKLNR